jgi:hypothetical protein
VKLQEAVTWVRRQIVILLYRLCACWTCISLGNWSRWGNSTTLTMI